MYLARVEGNVTATRKHPSLHGWRLLVCQPIGAAGHPEGAPQVAIDSLGAGIHQRVIISSDGASARKTVGDDKSPVRWLVAGIVDEKEPGESAGSARVSRAVLGVPPSTFRLPPRLI